MEETATVKTILERCRDQGIVLNVVGKKLGVDAPEETLSAEILQELRCHKAGLIRLLQEGDEKRDARECESTPGDEAIEPPNPCSVCGGIWFWWDVLEGRHCMKCDVPQYAAEKSPELKKLAHQLRQFPRKASSLRQAR